MKAHRLDKIELIRVTEKMLDAMVDDRWVMHYGMRIDWGFIRTYRPMLRNFIYH